jgi:hypothetical protein
MGAPSFVVVRPGGRGATSVGPLWVIDHHALCVIGHAGTAITQVV